MPGEINWARKEADDILHDLQDLMEDYPQIADKLAPIIERLAAMLGV
jgi:hypothetical protein